MARSRRSTRSSSRKPSAGSRAKVVWLSLLGAMTAVGGALLLLDGRPAPRVGGVSMPALVATGATSNLESLFNLKPDPRKRLESGQWTGIVIHHSDSPVGSPESIAAEHTQRNLKGIGHHFVIGNGRGMGDGELHVTFRWLEQLPGAHAAGKDGNFHNRHSISICLVGDGDREPFTRAQLSRLVELTEALCAELHIPRDRVYLHSQLAPTSDPGKLFPQQQFRAELQSTR